MPLSLQRLCHLCLITLLGLLPGGLACAAPAAPNFVVIVLDDWGWRESGAYGNTVIQTPHIDQLAREGAQFHNAFNTMSLCSPSRASILTGLYPSTAKAPRLHDALPASTRLVSYYLRQAGYVTAAAGKWHNGPNVLNQFDLFVPERLIGNEEQSGMEDWLDTIGKLPADKPFFVWLAAKDAHSPWQHDPRWSIHKAADINIPAYIQFNPKHTPEVVREEMAMYYDEIHRADFYIGEVIRAMRNQGKLDNTVVMILSDNGSPFWKAKKFLTDPGLKTPLIVYWPGHITGPLTLDRLTSSVDIAPSILDLAGLPVPPQMEGKSFADWLTKDSRTELNRYIYGEREDLLLGSMAGRSIRDKQFLYIIDDYETYAQCDDEDRMDYYRGEQLYDVVNDPDNLVNLARRPWMLRMIDKLEGKPDYSEVLLTYRNQMLTRRQSRHDEPKPVIAGECPSLWWRDAAPAPAVSGNPSPKDD